MLNSEKFAICKKHLHIYTNVQGIQFIFLQSKEEEEEKDGTLPQTF